jgi:putative ABC transport system substrate-binding protein
MRRRDFIRLGAGAVAARPLAALAQPSNSTRRIAVLMGFPEADLHAQSYVLATQRKLESLGWIEGRNIRIDRRWAGGDPALPEN